MLSAAWMCTLLKARLAIYCFASAVSTGGGGGGGFGPNVSQPNAPRIRINASAMTMLAGEILTSGNCHFSEHDGRGGDGAQEFQVVADFGDAVQHLLQRARDRHFRNRKSQFAIANPHPHRSAR